MTTGQRIIKYLALAFAGALIFTIISSMIFALNFFSGFLGINNDGKDLDLKELALAETNFSNIEIDLATTKLEIINANEFKIETNNNKINVSIKNNILEIKEKMNLFVNFIKNSKLIIYLPSSTNIEKFSIDSGAGSVNVATIYADKLELDIGAGNVEIDNAYIGTRADISGGVGSLSIYGGRINNLDLEVGVGSCEINSLLTGNNDIEAGIGKLDINLFSNIKEHTFYLEKGIGNIRINKQKINKTKYGNGAHVINIEAGIGNIDVTTIN